MELQQLDQMHPRGPKLTQGKDASLQCQLLLLRAQAHQCLSRQPGNIDRFCPFLTFIYLIGKREGRENFCQCIGMVAGGGRGGGGSPVLLPMNI